MEAEDFKDISLKDTFTILKSDIKGLTNDEASKRLREFGYNEIKEKRPNYLLKFLSKFYGPIPLLLYMVIAISYLLQNTKDLYIILLLLFFNSVVSFIEEYKADASVKLLNQKLAVDARVLRSGRWETLHSKMIAPGDIIRLRAGDMVPADLKIIGHEEIEVDESIITGESLPIEKKTNDLVHEGSVVKRGEATCIVLSTGEKTFYGKSANLLQNRTAKSHLQDVILNIVKYLVIADLIVIVIMFICGQFIFHVTLDETLPFFLLVFIASIPVTLPTAFTVAMSLGTEKLSRKSILVRKLDAIDDTAMMNVICIDKTGTLTQNKITIKEIVPFRFSSDEVIRYAAEASRSEDEDPIDNAVLAYAKAKKIKIGKQLRFSPFDSSTKRTEAIIKDGSGNYRVLKGATFVISKMCGLSGPLKLQFNKAVEEFSRQGYRSICIARSHGRKGLQVVGLIALYDEPRPDAKNLIEELKMLGIKAKILTGDTIRVARHLAQELDIKGQIVDISMIKRLKAKALNERINHSIGFANVYPEDKYIIVKALQNERLIVGMTGDGINDAPALKQSEVGIAVSNATDIAKNASAIVLTKNGIDVIISAIKESRRIFERMATYTMAKITRVFQIVGFLGIMFIGFHGFMPITPFLLILLMLTNDIANISVSTDNVYYSSRPDVWSIKAIMFPSAVVGVMLIIQALITVPINLYLFNMTVAQFQTATFLLLNVSDKFTLFNMREKRPFWKSRPSTALIVTSAIGIAIGILLSYYGIFIPKIGVMPIVAILLISLLFFLINDLVKLRALKTLGVK